MIMMDALGIQDIHINKVELYFAKVFLNKCDLNQHSINSTILYFLFVIQQILLYTPNQCYQLTYNALVPVCSLVNPKLHRSFKKKTKNKKQNQKDYSIEAKIERKKRQSEILHLIYAAP